MLNLDKFLIVSFVTILFGCSSSPSRISEKAIDVVGTKQYYKTYSLASDSVYMWMENHLGLNMHKQGQDEYMVDSLLCFNKAGTRLVTCILYRDLRPQSYDGLLLLLGEKISSSWYFCREASVVIPRSMIQEHNLSGPLSYQELHEIALKEVYAGYLDASGNINENWFKSHFENVGMCADCKTPEDFQKSFYLSAMAQWANRDTTQPIKRLNEKLP